MSDIIVNIFSKLSLEVATVLLATLPFTELRASIPVAITVFGFSAIKATLLSFIGNIIPIFFILLFLPSIVRFAEKNSQLLKVFLDKYFRTLEKKYKYKYEKYGSIILFAFVAVPLPGSGVWTASILAVLFKIRPKYSIPSIIAGLFISAILVLYITRGGIVLFT